MSQYVRTTIFLPYKMQVEEHQYLDLIEDLQQKFGGATHSDFPDRSLYREQGKCKTYFTGWWVKEKDKDGNDLASPLVIEDQITLIIIDIDTKQIADFAQTLRDFDSDIKFKFGEDAGWIIGCEAERFFSQ